MFQKRPIGKRLSVQAMGLLLLAIALSGLLRDGKAVGIDHQTTERDKRPCTALYKPGAVLMTPEMAEKLSASQNELATYTRSVSGPRHWGLEENLAVKASNDSPDNPFVLELKIPKGAINPGNKVAPRGGAGYLWTPKLPRGLSTACLTYKVWFPEDFDFVKGGKLPGLFGGEGPSGGKKVDGQNGFSTRFMWRTNGQGEVYAYIIGNDQRGISIERGAFDFKRGSWTLLAQEVTLNTPGQSDGVVRVWVNGKLVIERANLSYRSVDDVTIRGVMAHVFFGGKDLSWASSKDTIVRMTPFDLRWQKNARVEAGKQGVIHQVEQR